MTKRVIDKDHNDIFDIDDEYEKKVTGKFLTNLLV
jgi:hypothetical protein